MEAFDYRSSTRGLTLSKSELVFLKYALMCEEC